MLVEHSRHRAEDRRRLLLQLVRRIRSAESAAEYLANVEVDGKQVSIEGMRGRS
jgi:GTPase